MNVCLKAYILKESSCFPNARVEVHWFYGSCQVPFFLAVSFPYLTFPKIVALFYQETIKKGCIWK